MIERVRASVLIAVALLTLTACGDDGPDQPQAVADDFAAAIDSDDAAAAAALTTDPAAAAAAISQMFDGLGTEVDFGVADASADGVTFDVTWQLGPEGSRSWKYSTKAAASDTADGWRITWDPQILAPFEGDAGDLRYIPTFPAPAKVLDRNDRDLLTQQVVTLVQVDSSADLDAVAAALAPVAPDVTAAALATDLAAHGGPVTAVTLREADAATVESALGLPGVSTSRQTRLLTVDRALTSPVFADVTRMWEADNTAAQGWQVVAQAADGSIERLIGEDATPTPDIRTTLDLDLQAAAENALAPIPTPATIVALRPSTGEMLAVAQNAPADALGAIVLTGLYPPGSTFKMVTVTAALEAGAVTPDTVLACPGSANIEGRTIPNDENFDLGDVPLHTAFARSCNTTMGRLAVDLPAAALPDAAAQLGIGIDYVTPGVTTVTGMVPIPDSAAQRVESAIGQGTVTASPFGMALAAATIAHGSTQPPMFVVGEPGVGNRTATPVSPAVAADVRTMMRETVTAGTATALNDIPDLRGKTGTAEHEGGAAHGWFVAIDGDMAIAVFVADAGSSGPAVEASGRFLRDVAAFVPR